MWRLKTQTICKKRSELQLPNMVNTWGKIWERFVHTCATYEWGKAGCVRYWDSREEKALKKDKLSYHWYKLITIKSSNFGLRLHSLPWNVSTEEYVQAVNGDPLTICNLDETSNLKRAVSVPKKQESSNQFSWVLSCGWGCELVRQTEVDDVRKASAVKNKATLAGNDVKGIHSSWERLYLGCGRWNGLRLQRATRLRQH